jgi:hypothetical protein
MNTITKMETVAAKVVGPRDGRAGFRCAQRKTAAHSLILS